MLALTGVRGVIAAKERRKKGSGSLAEATSNERPRNNAGMTRKIHPVSKTHAPVVLWCIFCVIIYNSSPKGWGG